MRISRRQVPKSLLYAQHPSVIQVFAHTPISAQSCNFVVFRLHPVYLLSTSLHRHMLWVPIWIASTCECNLNEYPQHIRVRVTDRHSRHLRRKIKFGTKNHKLAKTSGEKKILSELPATEPYNCRACLSHLPWLYNSPINNSVIDQKTVADQINLNLMKVI